MPDVNFFSTLLAADFEFLGLLTLDAWRFECTALGAVGLPDILTVPWAILSSRRKLSCCFLIKLNRGDQSLLRFFVSGCGGKERR